MVQKTGEERIGRVWHCAARDCRFCGDDGRCYAMATMMDGEKAACEMYLPGLPRKLDEETAEVGWCNKRSCVFNEGEQCTARAIHVNTGESGPVCGTLRTGRRMRKRRSPDHGFTNHVPARSAVPSFA